VSPAPDQPPAVVVFDLGGVLATPVELFPRLAGLARVPVGRFEAAYWAHRAAYDAGGLDATYWNAVVTAAGGTPTDALTRTLTAADCEGWGDLPSVSWLLLAELAAAGTRLGLLSNAPLAMARWVRQADWARPFEHLVVSGEQGCLKPDRVVYELTAGLFAVDAARVLFFDDRTENVAGARRAGWDARLWVGPAGCRAVLAERGVLPAAATASQPGRGLESPSTSATGPGGRG